MNEKLTETEGNLQTCKIILGAVFYTEIYFPVRSSSILKS